MLKKDYFTIMKDTVIDQVFNVKQPARPSIRLSLHIWYIDHWRKTCYNNVLQYLIGLAEKSELFLKWNYSCKYRKRSVNTLAGHPTTTYASWSNTNCCFVRFFNDSWINFVQNSLFVSQEDNKNLVHWKNMRMFALWKTVVTVKN